MSTCRATSRTLRLSNRVGSERQLRERKQPAPHCSDIYSRRFLAGWTKHAVAPEQNRGLPRKKPGQSIHGRTAYRQLNTLPGGIGSPDQGAADRLVPAVQRKR